MFRLAAVADFGQQLKDAALDARRQFDLALERLEYAKVSTRGVDVGIRDVGLVGMCVWTVTVSHAWVGVASRTAQAAVAEDSDRRCGTVLETVMQAQQALKKRLTAQIQTLEGEGGEMQKKHEAFAAEAKKFLQHLMDGVSGLTAWRESATAGAKVRLVPL